VYVKPTPVTATALESFNEGVSVTIASVRPVADSTCFVTVTVAVLPPVTAKVAYAPVAE
jgi:hypothetical protein